jgi:serine/threonine protein kinase
MRDRLTGRRLDGYEIRERIGRGGMASVYRAWQSGMNREVAVKVLSADLGEAAEYPGRFEREVQVTATLEHPAILPIYDHGIDGDVHYIVMRLLTGGSLAERLEREGRPDPPEALRILERLADGLDHAHRRGVVHRDLKPGNILFDIEGNPYLVDFGIAGLVDAGSVLLTAEVAIGTPLYIAPEQVTGGAVDGRADQYALGVIAYELLTGEPPFGGTTAMAVLLQHVQTDPQPGELPEPVFAPLRRALSKEPDQRFGSVTEFVHALRKGVRAAGWPVTMTFSQRAVRPPSAAAPVGAAADGFGVATPISAPSIARDGTTVALDIPRAAAPRAVKQMAPALLEFTGLVGVVALLVLLVNMLLPAPGIPWLPVMMIALGAWAVARFEPHERLRAMMARRDGGEVASLLERPDATPLPKEHEITRPIRLEPEAPPHSPAASLEILEPGDMLAEYRVESRLDEGNRTRVYHAFDTHRHRHVALKVIGRERAGGTRTARFQQEARLLGRLHHAHIVPFFDFGSVDEVNYIVMPMLGGKSLSHRLRTTGVLSLAGVIEMTTQVGGALDYLHAQGVVHRDLKPNNLVFDTDGNVYLADLGIAKVMDEPEDLNLTGVGQPLGTPAYMAPEQWLGSKVEPATDQYALGCIIYEALSGKPPFEAENPFGLMLKHVREEPAKLGGQATGLPQSIDDVLRRALEKDPANRFASICDFADGLRETILPPPVEVDPKKSGHVFISYSRDDGDYAYALAENIRAKGFDVWIDSRIEPSDRWWRTIVAALDGCAAFVAIMTPAAAASRWVEREVLLADRHEKPAFPLLLEGDTFPIYVSTQYTDVTGRRMPPDVFYTRLAAVVRRSS